MSAKKMLIVDDVRVLRNMLVNIFEADYEILQAEDGLMALEVLRRERDQIFVVLLDIVLPHKNGYEVLREMKASEELKDIPVIIITALDSFDDEMRALDLGAMDVIFKPFEPRIVKKRVENVLNLKMLELALERNRQLEQQKIAEERYRIIVDQTGMIVMEWNSETGAFYASEELKQFVFGQRRGQDLFLDWRLETDVHQSDHGIFGRFLTELNLGKERNEVTARFKRVDGSYIWCKLAVTCLRSLNSKIKRMVGTIADIDKVVRNQNELKYWAEYDSVTGIHNRNAFERLTQKLIRENIESKYAIFCINVKKFKLIKDIYGEDVSNRLLLHIAAVLRKYATFIGVCARSHDDIFDMCMPYGTKDDLVTMVKDIEMDVMNSDMNIKVNLSFGICLAEQRNTPINLLSDRASFAEVSIRGNVVVNWAFYDERMRAKQMEEREIESEMQEALEQRQFVVYLQSKHDINSGKIVGAESLVRWRHPTKGLLSPAKFVPLFERNGFIINLDEFMWEQTCIILKRWLDKGLDAVPISVNVSRLHVYRSTFVDKLNALVGKYKIPSDLLELELTESTFIEKTDELFRVMNKIREYGFRFAMDDFGSGYSSLNMLKDAPLSIIKFDRSFLRENFVNGNGATILRHMIAMARELNLIIVAEGAETIEQIELLKKLGCPVVQGYYFSKPVPVAQFEAMAFVK